MATVAPATPSTPERHDWTKPSAMAIPKEVYFAPKARTIWTDLSTNARVSRFYPNREDQTGKRGCDPCLWQDHREGDR